MAIRRPITKWFCRRVGRWTILREVAPPRGYESQRYVECRCDCGARRELYLQNVTRGMSKSCGCLKDETTRARSRTHGMSKSPEYKIWIGMKKRCDDPTYADYGGRGIRVCAAWDHDFSSFYRDMGPRPSPRHTIERINNDGPYAPDNCRWATKREQSLNTRRNHFLELDGTRKTLGEWATDCGIDRLVVLKRLKRGWGVRRALTAPLQLRRS